MTRVIKKYWAWNERFNNTEFKLGVYIKDLVLNNKVVQNENDINEFFGSNNYPWKIKVNDDGKIISVFFRETFFNFPEDHIWDYEFEKFNKYVDNLLEPKNEEQASSGDSFYVVFRGGFVAVAGIIRNE